MSVINGVWHDAVLDPPGVGQINRTVLTVRKIGQGKNEHKEIDISIFNATTDRIEEGKWNKRGVIFWMNLPKIPED